ncbi:MAG: hypothetical protein AVDCRST_MAG16-1884, partial [uncultured Frankineae bacterium]
GAALATGRTGARTDLLEAACRRRAGRPRAPRAPAVAAGRRGRPGRARAAPGRHRVGPDHARGERRGHSQRRPQRHPGPERRPERRPERQSHRRGRRVHRRGAADRGGGRRGQLRGGGRAPAAAAGHQHGDRALHARPGTGGGRAARRVRRRPHLVQRRLRARWGRRRHDPRAGHAGGQHGDLVGHALAAGLRGRRGAGQGRHLPGQRPGRRPARGGRALRPAL